MCACVCTRECGVCAFDINLQKTLYLFNPKFLLKRKQFKSRYIKKIASAIDGFLDICYLRLS